MKCSKLLLLLPLLSALSISSPASAKALDFSRLSRLFDFLRSKKTLIARDFRTEIEALMIPQQFKTEALNYLSLSCKGKGVSCGTVLADPAWKLLEIEGALGKGRIGVRNHSGNNGLFYEVLPSSETNRPGPGRVAVEVKEIAKGNRCYGPIEDVARIAFLKTEPSSGGELQRTILDNMGEPALFNNGTNNRTLDLVLDHIMLTEQTMLESIFDRCALEERGYGYSDWAGINIGNRSAARDKVWWGMSLVKSNR